MNAKTDDFTLQVDGVKGLCPAGEAWAERQIQQGRIPVLACEGPCIRGEIARLAANRVAKEVRFGRACYAEAFLVPHSSMTRWVKEADKILMIDGCFFNCIGRILNNFVDQEKIIHFDALQLYDQYTDLFDMDDVSEADRLETAKLVADRILSILKTGENQIEKLDTEVTG